MMNNYNGKGSIGGGISFTIVGDHDNRPTHQTNLVEKDMDEVRRLTPLECERLQGYPDNWTLIGTPREKEVKDYKIYYDEDFNVVKKEEIGSHIEIEYVYEQDGKEKVVTDSARYKALGNSIALPQWFWIAQKMKHFLPKGATVGSLFDGIGGFPLVWELTYGKGTGRWASEIEPFPIAVTKERFPEDPLIGKMNPPEGE